MTDLTKALGDFAEFRWGPFFPDETDDAKALRAEVRRLRDCIAQAHAPFSEAVTDATRFLWMQDNPMKAQAFFWNYKSRKQRVKAIDAAMKEQG